MSDQVEHIRVRRGELNGHLSDMFRDELHKVVSSLPEYETMKGPPIGETDSARPRNLPDGSIFLYAETGPESQPILIGSICLVVLHSSSPNFTGLPADVNKAGEIKRTIVLDGYRRRGVGRVLIEALEKIARNEMGLKYMVIETVWGLKGGQSLYESSGYSRRQAWGQYSDHDSVFYEKWL